MTRIALALALLIGMVADTAIAQRPRNPDPDRCCKWVPITRCDANGQNCRTRNERVCYEQC
jgi:hypothetical protein